MNFMLPWNMNVLTIPVGKPVLVWQQGEEIPFMAIRKAGFPEGTVVMLEGTDKRGTGYYFSAEQLSCWLEVC
jgi:hypothetical protein